jgi:FkbM family methyltransferase
MSNPETGTIMSTLQVLFNKGIRYSTVIDVGCADGNFFLHFFAMGLFPGAVPLNIDANRLYEDSLRAIKNVVGGEFCISAVTDHEGAVELTTSVHPYWSSLRAENDPYWTRINNLVSTKIAVPATTLDTLYRQYALKPPFLLKLDVQGAEKSVLRGAADLLKDTHVVICEADVDDFQDINEVLVQSNFVLYDATQLQRLSDGTLGWFHPVYVNRALDHVRPGQFWDAKRNDDVIRIQVERRHAILKSNAELLARLRAQRTPAPIVQS